MANLYFDWSYIMKILNFSFLLFLFILEENTCHLNTINFMHHKNGEFVFWLKLDHENIEF